MAKKKPGKYDDIVDTLPRFLGEDPKQREKIDAIRAEINRPAEAGDPLVCANEDDVTIISVQNEIDRFLWHMTRANTHSKNAAGFARTYIAVRRVKEALEEQVKRINVLHEAVKELVIDHYEIEGSESISLIDGGTVRVQYEPRAVIKNHDALRTWCINNGFANKMALPWQTLNAELKERLVNGDEEPDGVEAFTLAKLYHTKG
jgi:hypothetical protein